MAKAWIHAASSAKKFGGVPDDYMPLHELMDSSKKVIADNRHRILTHQSWFIAEIIPRIFGKTAVNSEGRVYCPADVAEQHVLEDFAMAFIPTPQDFVQGMPMEGWMQNGSRGSLPPSATNLYKGKAGTITYELKD